MIIVDVIVIIWLLTLLRCVLYFITFEGKVYDPADIAIVNKPNGVEFNDIPSGLKALAQMFLGLP